MRILLIRPPVPRQTIGLKSIMVCEPLELEYAAAGLDGHEVMILDLILEDGLERRLREFRPDIVGTSSYITGVNEVKKLCRTVKRHDPGCLTVAGGVQATLAPEDFLDPGIDCVALGEGSALMAEIAAARAAGRPLDTIAGLALRRGAALVRTAPRPYMAHPDTLPFPRRDLTAHLRERYYYLFHQPVALMKTAWGCGYRCSFCCNWRVTGGPCYVRSPGSIADELETIACDDIYIVDDLFLTDRERLAELARLVRRRGIRKNYLVFGRADFIAANEDMIAEWASLGLKAVLIGLEATTDDELDDMNKRTTLDANYEAVRVLTRQGIDTYGSLIPQPDYLPADWDRLWRFVKETGIYYLNVSPLTPYPGSVVWSGCRDLVTVPREAHPLWDLTHCLLPTRMSLRGYYGQLRRLYTRTCLDLRRADRLSRRSRPPVWSRRFLRLWGGGLRIFWQLLWVHRHHSGRQLAAAMDLGPALDGSEAAWEADVPTPERFTRAGRSVCEDLFAPGPSPRPTVTSLVDTHGADVLFGRIDAAVGSSTYPYQRSSRQRSGPRVTVGRREMLMLSSYDYLGLIGHPHIDEAARRAIDRFGTGSGGVRLLTGTTTLHDELDHDLAGFKGTEAALTFSSGYLANLAVIAGLFGPDDCAILDSLAHRSLVDACRVAHVPTSTFAHNDVADLRRRLEAVAPGVRTVIVVEGVYSMDGDICPLPAIVALKQEFGAFLMVDEAHSFCVLGPTGRGVDEHFGLAAGCVDIWMGTLSKAIPSNGGFVAGSRELVVYLQHASAGFIFSAALAPAAAAAALAALAVVRAEPERLVRAGRNADHLRQGLQALGLDTGSSASPVVPVIVGDEPAAFGLAHRLFGLGLLATPVVHPAVARHACRLRLCATAGHRPDDIAEALDLMERACTGKEAVK